MILQRLTLCNFRVFQGEHSFELGPRWKHGRQRPIILFGGLNGAGKTTILTAVRLALYGKSSLGATVSRKTYDEYLANSVHKGRNVIQSNAAYVTLAFSYAKQGQVSAYEIKREWSVRNKTVEESLTIHKDGACMGDFSPNQCQAFLNELVPIGVSELFFFDGERIAELAEDTNGEALQDAVRKLLGLDVIDRLRGDLQTFLRQRKKEMLPEEIQKGIDLLEKEYVDIERQKNQKMEAADEIHKEIAGLAHEIKKLRSDLESRGGAWAETRKSVLEKQDRLLQEKEDLENRIREVMSGICPLAAVQPKLEKLLCGLEKKRDLAKKQLLSTELSGRLKKLRRNLSESLPSTHADKAHQLVEQAFDDMLIKNKGDMKDDQSDFGLSEVDVQKIKHWVKELIPQDQDKLAELGAQLQSTEEKIASASLKLARAPDEATLKEEFDLLSEKNRELGGLHLKKKRCLEDVCALLSKSIQLNQKMQKLQDQKESAWYSNQSVAYAGNARGMLGKFIEQTAERRASKLGDEFERTFAQIARKEDMHVKVHVDPETFEVTLLNASGAAISKQDLSAGEKQIFAISILGALGKTSGRNLPIIVDTPLGRLDSEHRKKLVEHYFPCASHQVIILSTDTEVDASFYKVLSPEISRAYEINYDPEPGCSIARSGYFWRQNQRGLRHAS